MKSSNSSVANGNVAYLSNDADVISFSHNNRVIRFRGPYSLKKIEKVLEWDNGYIVVLASYAHSAEPIEDYIDMKPILEDLYIDDDYFLQGIDTVEVNMPEEKLIGGCYEQ